MEGDTYHTAWTGRRGLSVPRRGVDLVNRSLGEAWDEAASDPDPHSDLDYELQPLTVIKLEEKKGGSYMILPGEADHLESEEFMVADPGSVCRLDECR